MGKNENGARRKNIWFFYAPGANREDSLRDEFYEDLRTGVEQYKDKKMYLLGDSNANLGEFSADQDIKGNIKSNKNETLFLGFIQFADLKYLNRIFKRGKPTDDISGTKR